MTDEELLEQIRRQMAPDWPDANVGAMKPGAMMDVVPLEYDDDNPEPAYPNAPKYERPESIRGKMYDPDYRQRQRMLDDPHHDDNFLIDDLDDIRNVMINPRSPESQGFLEATRQGPEPSLADRIPRAVRGMNPDDLDADIQRALRQRMGFESHSPILDPLNRAMEERSTGFTRPMSPEDAQRRALGTNLYPQGGRRSRYNERDFEE